jgi:hypothetical protein
MSRKGCCKEVHFLFHLPVSLQLSLLISVDKNLCGHLQKLASTHSSESLQFLQFSPYVSLGLANQGGIKHPLVFSGFQVKAGEQTEGLTQTL